MVVVVVVVKGDRILSRVAGTNYYYYRRQTGLQWLRSSLSNTVTSSRNSPGR